jgi:SHS2 domain-containing protein
LKEAFENAALATFETMTDTNRITPKLETEVEAEGFDEKALLYDWLETLLVCFETTETLYSQFEITSFQRSSEGYKLKAKVCGERFDSGKHVCKVGVKAVTYHRMEIEKKPDQVTVKFILDI